MLVFVASVKLPLKMSRGVSSLKPNNINKGNVAHVVLTGNLFDPLWRVLADANFGVSLAVISDEIQSGLLFFGGGFHGVTR